MNRVFVITGHEGFIGSNLIDTLRMLGHRAVGINSSYLKMPNWKLQIHSFLDTVKPDGIFHVGACSDTLEQDVNYMMVRNYEATKVFTDWCVRNSKPIIYSSSAANYGVNNNYPANLYGWSKYAGEDYVVNSKGIALRYFNVYGPGEHKKGRMASIAYQMFLKYRNGEVINLFPNKPCRDFVYVKDVVDANIHAYINYDKLHSKYYEVGSGTARPFEDVLSLMNIEHGYVSESLIPEGYQYYTCSDKTKWMKGWTPKYQLEDGIEDYLCRL